ncbi:unnamed protein product [Haemonchus placei]|uniref:Transposase n=1 Tax=Haemonchus placei TaxID=6290 RepID=A0A0N4WS50_HAEPC|nr:unnamed protein product [Haemonchus placei]
MRVYSSVLHVLFRRQKKEWCKLAWAIATAARNEMKILSIAPPRGDAAYAQNRMKVNQAAELGSRLRSCREILSA